MAGVVRGEGFQVDALLRPAAQQAGEIGIDRVRQKRRERGHEFRAGQQHVVQAVVRGMLVCALLAAPEAPPVEAHVPVGQCVQKVEQRRHDVVQPIRLHLGVDAADQRLLARADPAVQDVRRACVRGRAPVVHQGVRHEEFVGIPPRQQQTADGVAHAGLAEAQVLGAHQRRVDQVQTQGVGAVRGEDGVGLGIVLEPLAHLLAVFGQDEPVDDHVLERGFVEQSRGDDHQRVEPAARLVEPFGDEVRGKRVRESLGLLERVVDLGVRHGAALEPAVEHERHAAQHTLPRRIGEGQAVHELAVQIGHARAATLGQLVDAADARHLGAVRVLPDRERRAPIAVAADGPVARVFQPVAEPAVAQVVRHPGGQRIVVDQPVAERFDAHEPRGDRFVDERRVAPPAVGITVGDGALVHDVAGAFEVADDLRVGLLDVLAGEVGHLHGETAVVIDGVDQRHARPLAGGEVLFAERGRHVHDAGAFVGRDVR